MSSGTRIVALVLLAIAGLTLGGLTLLGFAYRLVREKPPAAPVQVQDAGTEASRADETVDASSGDDGAGENDETEDDDETGDDVPETQDGPGGVNSR